MKQRPKETGRPEYVYACLDRVDSLGGIGQV